MKLPPKKKKSQENSTSPSHDKGETTKRRRKRGPSSWEPDDELRKIESAIAVVAQTGDKKRLAYIVKCALRARDVGKRVRLERALTEASAEAEAEAVAAE